MTNVTDITKLIPNDPVADPDKDPTEFTEEELEKIVMDGHLAVHEHLRVIPEMLLGLTNAAQQHGAFRLLLAQKREEKQ